MLFHKPDSLDHIRFNVFSVHSMVTILGGVTLAVVMPFFNSNSPFLHLAIGLSFIVLGSISLWGANKRINAFVPLNLVLITIALFVLYLISNNPNEGSPIVLGGFITLIPLIAIFRGFKTAFASLLILIIIIILRLYLLQYGFFSNEQNDIPPLIHITIFSVFIFYIAVVFGYYSTQIRSFIHRIQENRERVLEQLEISEINKNELSTIIDEIRIINTRFNKDLNSNLELGKDMLLKTESTDYNRLQNIGDRLSAKLDATLREINRIFEEVRK